MRQPGRQLAGKDKNQNMPNKIKIKMKPKKKKKTRKEKPPHSTLNRGGPCKGGLW